MPSKSLPWLPFCVAIAITTLLGSIAQTQFNLAALQQLGADISADIRLHATLHDLRGFTPTLAALVLAAFVVALPLSAWLTSGLGAWRWAVFLLAGALAVWLTLSVANALAPMPTLIAANRGLAGTLTLMLSGAAGALAFAWLSRGERE